MIIKKEELATSIIKTWAGALINAKKDETIPQFVEKYYYTDSFFKPTLAAFVKNGKETKNKDMINYFESFANGLVGFARPENEIENPNVIQADWIDASDPKLVAKGTYNFLFDDPASSEHQVIVRADFSFIFAEIK